MATVLFLHGLNTFGDDDLHVGPVRFGRMDRVLVPELQKRLDQGRIGGHSTQPSTVLSVDGIGGGSPAEHAEIALRFLQEKNLAEENVFHLIGHSAGGLAARALAAHPEMQGRVRSVLTWGSPHHGTAAAEEAIRFPDRNPLATRALAQIGYDVRIKSKAFSNYTREALKVFNAQHPAGKYAPEYSFVCALPLSRAAAFFWPLQWSTGRSTGTSSGDTGDGLVSKESQTWATTRGPYAIDHFSQLGFFALQPHPVYRREARQEFARLLDDMAALILSH